MQPARPNAEIIEKEIGEYKKGQVSFEQRTGVYNDLLGFTPPRIEARFRVTGALDPTVLDLQEQLRNHAMNPKCFDTKTAQLMVFGMLLMDLSDAATMHAIASRRAGASWEEMQAVVSLCSLFRGVSAANRGAEILANVAKREHDAASAGNGNGN